MTYTVVGCERTDRLVGSESAEYFAPDLHEATAMLREDVRSLWGDNAANEVDSDMLEVIEQ